MTDDKLAQFRKIKVPLWARIAGWFAARKRLKHELRRQHYITTLYAWTYHTDKKCWYKSWYICKETGAGVRSYEFGTELWGREDKESPVYASIVAPWMLGGMTHDELLERAPVTWKVPETPPNG